MKNTNKISRSLKLYYRRKKMQRDVKAVIGFILIVGLIAQFFLALTPKYTTPSIVRADEYVVEKKSVEAKELSVREWVKMRVEEERLDWNLIDCLIRMESNYRVMAYYVNRNGSSVDRGLWMWNDKWNKHISNECAFDYKCATNEALKKIKRDGGVGAWYGALKCQ